MNLMKIVKQVDIKISVTLFNVMLITTQSRDYEVDRVYSHRDAF